MKKVVKVEAIKEFLGESARVFGDYHDVIVDNVSDVEHTTEFTLDWVNKRKDHKQEIAENSIAKTIIVDPSVQYSDKIKRDAKILIVVDNPRMALAKIITEFFVEKPEGFIHPSAVIDKEAEISDTASIGPGCVIGKSKIGSHTVLKPNVVVYDGVTIGNNCLIQAGAIIGTDGLGCMREADGKLVKFPHLGGVFIGNDVEIGANCQIAKGVLSDTIIKDGCKINGLCFIAHNCLLNENVWITGDTMLCGTVSVGKNTTIFSNVIVRDQRIIGENVVVGMGSVVTKSIPDGEVWMGAPAHMAEKV